MKISFKNQIVLITGATGGIGKSLMNQFLKSEAKVIAENNGGKVMGSISKKLDFLVVGDSKPTKKKIDQAKKLNIEIILEKDWNKILNS